MTNGASVSVESGMWAVLLVVLVAAILAAALYPARRTAEEQRMCGERNQQGVHRVGPPDAAGVASCRCGLRRVIPAGVRTDTREAGSVGVAETAPVWRVRPGR